MSSVRRRTLAVGRRPEADLLATEPAPEPETLTSRDRVIMGLDGGFVRHCRPRSGRNFELIVGRIVGHAPRSRSLGFVRTVESTRCSRERIRRRVAEEGGRSDTMTLFTDGDSDLRDLQRDVLPQAAHVLDWYHLSRRLSVLRQLLLGEDGIRQLPTCYHDRLYRALEALKWHLWHAHPWRACRSLHTFRFTLRLGGIAAQPVARKLRRHAALLSTYLEGNKDSLPDYGRRHRAGERVASSFVESALNLSGGQADIEVAADAPVARRGASAVAGAGGGGRQPSRRAVRAVVPGLRSRGILAGCGLTEPH